MDIDYLFHNNIKKIYDQHKINSIISLLHRDKKAKKHDRLKIEQFFAGIKMKMNISMFDTVIVFCETYDINMGDILKHTTLLSRISKEVKNGSSNVFNDIF